MSNKQSYAKKVLQNSSWMIASKIINIIIGLFVSVFIARYLGPEQKGMMADASAIAGFFGFLATFGLLDIMIARFASEKDKSATNAATAMCIMLCGSALAIILSIISAKVLGVSENVFIYVAIDSSVYLTYACYVYEYWFYSNSNSKLYAIVQSAVHFVFLAIRFIGIPLKEGLTYFVVVAAAESVIINCSTIYCYKKNKLFFQGDFKFDLVIAKNLIRLSLPMVAMGFATTIYMKVDQIMVGRMIGNKSLGLYSVAINLAEYWYFIPATIYSSFLPLLTAKYESKYGFSKALLKFSDIMTGLGYLAILIVTVFGKFGIRLLYGDAYEESAKILLIYIWSGLFTCLSYSGQAYYIIHKDTKTIMILNVMGAITNLVLNIILIRYFGSMGAAFATLLEYVFVAFGQMIIMYRKYGELYRIQLQSLFPFLRLGGEIKRVLQHKWRE